MKIAYIDASAGISGDMFLGAVFDAGIDVEFFTNELKKLNLDGFSISAYKCKRAGITATKVDVNVTEQAHCHRQFKDIEAIVSQSHLDPEVKSKGLRIFKEIFLAEAKVHGVAFHEAHLHELGAVDCIIDIIGTVIGLQLLGIKRLYVSDINVGSGIVYTAHGTLPVPAPATAELLRGYRFYSTTNADFELTTPTGSAIIRGLEALQCPLPSFAYDTVAYGAGGKDPAGFANVLRLFIAEIQDEEISHALLLKTNIDDMNPQIYPVVIDKLFEIGVYDVWMQNTVMKKCRPGIELSVLTSETLLRQVLDILFRETTTIGVRLHRVDRLTLKRQVETLSTPHGQLRVKKAIYKDEVVNIQPEFEDLRNIASKTGIAIKRLRGKFYPD